MNHIMIDLEMNKIDKQQRGDIKLSSELIEIGAVKMDDQFEVIDQYQTYVAPDYGAMDHRIIALTGITDDKLVGAWFYSWSMSDIRQFQTESTFKEYKGPIIARMESHWTDFQEVYSELLGINKKIKLKQAVTAADYEFTGAQHTALADAVNTAEILRLSKDADKFERVMKPVLDLFRPDKDQPTLLDMCPEFFASFMEESAGSE